MLVKNRFLKFFPIPEYLLMSGTALDISDQSIKFFELKLDQNGIGIKKHGEAPVAAGVIESGLIKNKEALTQALTKLGKEQDVSEVVVSLPEEQAFVARIRVPYVPKKDLRGSIELQLEEHIPLPASEAVFDYDIYREPADETGNYDISVVAFPVKVLADYHECLTGAGLKPLAYEVEMHSVARALARRNDPSAHMIVDIGKTRTGICIESRGVILFSATVPGLGGDQITAAIQKSLGVSAKEAEKIKIEKGLVRAGENKDLFHALIPIVSTLRDEISRYFIYWQTHRDGDEMKDKIGEVLLCGGQSTLPGLADYVTANLDALVTVADPWVNILDTKKEIPPIDFHDSLRFSTAIGLALRNIVKNI